MSDGRELTAGSLCERFGFRGDKTRTFVEDLSGGERRRLQLMRLLITGPNVLLLDEPTNDLDTETLTALEDLLDGWPGTLVIASHDRYFVERVADSVYAISPDRGVRHLPGGVDQYLALHSNGASTPDPAGMPHPNAGRARRSDATTPGASLRAAGKEIRRIEGKLEKLEKLEAQLLADMATNASDHQRLSDLQSELDVLQGERDGLETAWLHASAILEQ